MKTTLSILFLSSSLLMSSCAFGGGGDPNRKITEETYNKEVLQAGFCDYTANAIIRFSMVNATNPSKSQDLELTMANGKYHSEVTNGNNLNETYAYAERDGDKIMAYYYQKNQSGEWEKSEGEEKPKMYEDYRDSLFLFMPSFDKLAFDGGSNTYKCAEYISENHRGTVSYKDISLYFVDNHLSTFSYTFTFMEEEVNASGGFYEFDCNDFNLPDGYDPLFVELPVGRKTQGIFIKAIRGVDNSSVTSGASSVRVLLKQNNKVTNDDNGEYTHTKVDGQWTTSGQGTGSAATMNTAYNHTVDKYREYVNIYQRYANYLNVGYIINSDSFKVAITGELDFEKFYGRGFTGALAMSFELEWNLNGMLTYWYLSLDGNVTNGTSNILYQEEDTIICSWN